MPDFSPEFLIGATTRAWAQAAGLEVSFTPQLPSTNDQAKEEFGKTHSQFKLYVTDYQTLGRGRATNTWASPSAGTALFSTWSFACAHPIQPIFSQLVGLAVFLALEATWPALPWSLKAPNDIYLGAKKAAGLLIETLESGTNRRVIIGLGLNVFAIPDGLANATSIAGNLGLADPKLIIENWPKFLGHLLNNLQTTLKKGSEHTLTAGDRDLLMRALNLNPALTSKILSIEVNGSLVTAAGRIDWQAL